MNTQCHWDRTQITEQHIKRNPSTEQKINIKIKQQNDRLSTTGLIYNI